MLHKSFAILEAISSNKAGTVDSISEVTGIPRSTVHRILQMLQDEEVVAHKKKQGYVLTPKLLSIGLGGMAERDMLDVTIPLMRQLSEVIQETISLNVISGYERVCVYRIEGSQPITRNIRIGSRAPLFVGSAGKIIASGLSDQEKDKILERYVAAGELEEAEIPKLLHAVEMVKNQGFAVSIGERVHGSASIAVPIQDFMDNVVASLSVSTLESRLTPAFKKTCLDHLLDTAKQIQQSYCFFR